MIIRSRAPLRLGLAGGGTDVSPFSDLYGGAILNSTVSLYVYATIEESNDGFIHFHSLDLGKKISFKSNKALPLDNDLSLFAGVYNRIIRDFNIDQPLSFKLTSYVEVPKGSGLGTSSTVCVAILGAFVEWLGLGLGEYEIARLAYEIEREDLSMAGGKQDQYAATFGGVNYMEFGAEANVMVNPLRVKSEYLYELEHNLLLYYTGTSRLSSLIIENQQKEFQIENSKSIQAGKLLKTQAIEMKKALLTGNINDIGPILHQGWVAKKQMTSKITNKIIDDIYARALKAGATGGKISGAGGGGYFIVYCPGNTCYKVMEELNKMGGKFEQFKFEKKGLMTWKVML